MKMIKHLVVLALFSLMSFVSYSQISKNARVVHFENPSKLSEIQRMEDTLVFLADSMKLSPVPEARIAGSYAFIKSMKRFLQHEKSFGYEAKKLSNKISVIQPKDKRFKMYTWDVVRSNTQLRYYGALQLADGSFQPLIDASDQIIRGAEDSTFFNMRWYGSIYYNIIQKKIGEQDAYFLFGYNGNSISEEKKIVEPFGFDKNGRAIFGAPVFSVQKPNRKRPMMRFILQYQKNAKISLNYDKERDMIVYDHCESSVGDDNKKNTFVPDGTYDGLSWDGRYWKQKENVIQILNLPDGQAPVAKPVKE
jgi:hypothetical protein